MNLHLLLLAVYSALLVGVGLWIGRKVSGAGDFFVARRRLGPVLVFATVLAANIGAGSTVGATGIGYSRRPERLVVERRRRPRHARARLLGGAAGVARSLAPRVPHGWRSARTPLRAGGPRDRVRPPVDRHSLDSRRPAHRPRLGSQRRRGPSEVGGLPHRRRCDDALLLGRRPARIRLDQPGATGRPAGRLRRCAPNRRLRRRGDRRAAVGPVPSGRFHRLLGRRPVGRLPHAARSLRSSSRRGFCRRRMARETSGQSGGALDGPARPCWCSPSCRRCSAWRRA